MQVAPGGRKIVVGVNSGKDQLELEAEVIPRDSRGQVASGLPEYSDEQVAATDIDTGNDL